MDREAAYWKQVDAVLAAASGGAPWGEALSGLADYHSCDGSQCLVFSKDGRQLHFGDVGRIDPAAQLDYERDYAAHDFRRSRYLSHPPFVPVTEGELTTPAERARSPFHQEFLRKYDCENLLLANFPLPQDRIGVLVLGRSTRAPAFDDALRHGLMRMLRPLQSALRTAGELESLRQHALTLERYVDGFSSSVFLLSHAGRLLHANASARLLLARRRAFRVVRQKLLLHEPVQSARFESLLSQLRALAPGALAETQYMRIAADHAQPELEVSIRRIAGSRWAADAAHGGFVVTVVDVTCRRDDHQALKRLYGLTAAEARCASLLRDGCSVTDISAQLNIALPTVRAHLQNLYRKTDTHRQGELVAKLHRSVATQAGGGTPPDG